MTTTDENKIMKKTSSYNWLLWWNVDENELQEQIEGYETLKITKSARKISALLLLFSASVTTIFILSSLIDSSAFFDVFLFLILSLFIWRGHKWAMIGAMILWTFEKLFSLFSANGLINSPIVTIFWWTSYMHAFYLSFKVEGVRKKFVE